MVIQVLTSDMVSIYLKFYSSQQTLEQTIQTIYGL